MRARSTPRLALTERHRLGVRVPGLLPRRQRLLARLPSA